MRIPIGKVFQVLGVIYKLFVKGKKITLPGGGEFTFPQERPTVPVPDPREMPRAFGLVGSEEELVVVDDQPPFPVQTLGLLVFIVFGLPIVALVMLGVVEWRTLADDVPGNHITATLRRCFTKSPGAVTLALVVWVAFLVAVAAGISAHAFWT